MTIEETCEKYGTTRLVMVSGDFGEFEGFMRPDADEEDIFLLVELETGERLRINGWMVVVWEIKKPNSMEE